MNPSIITIKNVSKHFIQDNKNILILNNVCATFTCGQTYAITGQSGAGKSTLLHIIAGLDNPTSGSVLFNNTALHSLHSSQHSHFLNNTIGLVFQSPYLIKELTVKENIMVPWLIAQKTYKEGEIKTEMLLHTMNLLHKLNAKPGELSGGQQQRVALARALINDPLFLLADEPTGNLDHETGVTVIELLLSYQKEKQMGVIISSHDSSVITKMEHVYELHNGTLTKREQCPTQEQSLKKQPLLQAQHF